MLCPLSYEGVPVMGFEPISLAAAGFKSAVYTVPPDWRGNDEIRTHVPLARPPVFQTGPFNLSGTLPR